MDAYRFKSTGVGQDVTDKGDSTAEGVAIKVSKAILPAAAKLPFIGGLFSVMDGAIGVFYKEQDSLRTKSICNIIMLNKDKDCQIKEKLSLVIAKAALKTAEMKRKVFEHKNFLKNQVVVGEESKHSRVVAYILKKVEEIKESLKDPMYTTLGAEEALADVMICFTYFYKNSRSITDKSETIPLDE